MAQTRWWRAAALSDVPEGEIVGVKIGARAVALCRVEGQVHAIDDICTHEYALLSQGFLEGLEIECPLHAARFDVVTGKCLLAPAHRDLRSYPVRIDGEDIFVDVPEG